MKLSKYFSSDECKCKGTDCCGGTFPMDRGFLEKMDTIRASYGTPIHVNCGFRCLTHNNSIGGVANSWHTRGRAMDCKVDDLQKLYDIAKNYCKEVILYNTFVHIADED